MAEKEFGKMDWIKERAKSLLFYGELIQHIRYLKAGIVLKVSFIHFEKEAVFFQMKVERETVNVTAFIRSESLVICYSARGKTILFVDKAPPSYLLNVLEVAHAVRSLKKNKILSVI